MLMVRWVCCFIVVASFGGHGYDISVLVVPLLLMHVVVGWFVDISAVGVSAICVIGDIDIRLVCRCCCFVLLLVYALLLLLSIVLLLVLPAFTLVDALS